MKGSSMRIRNRKRSTYVGKKNRQKSTYLLYRIADRDMVLLVVL